MQINVTRLAFPVQSRPATARAQVWLLAVFAAAVLPGCSSQNLSTVQGIVSFDGTPLEDAHVMLMISQSTTPIAIATTNKGGEFTMASSGSAKGVPPGSYKVVVFKVGNIRPRRPQASQPPRVVPAVYGDVATTPLSIEVPTRGDVTFELKSK